MAGTWTWIGSTDDPSAPGNWTLTAGSSSHSTPQSGDTVTFPGGTTVPPLFANTTFTDADINLINNATVDLSNTGSNPFDSGIDGASTIDVSGTATTLSIAGPFSNAGLIEVTGTSDNLAIQLTAGTAAAGMLVNSGTIVVDQGDRLIITGGTLQSPAGIDVNGNALISSTLSGLDNFAIGNGGSLELTQAGSNALTEITFGGTTGLVKLDAPAAFVGGINDFVLGDTLDLGVFNAATVIFDGAGDITVIGTDGVFTASDYSSDPLDGFDNQGTFTLTATGGLAGNLNVVEGSGGDTVLTALPPSTWEWENVTQSFSLVGGPGNGWDQPQPGDTAIVTAGTVNTGTHTNLTNNTVELGGTTGIAAFSALGDSETSLTSPTIDGNSIITSAVPGNTSAEQSLLSAGGIFINEGQIEADGPAGSSFTIAISDATIDGTLQPGYFINYNQIQVAPDNSMTITVAGTSELLNAGEIEVDGGTLVINAATDAIAGGYAPGTGVIVIDGGGTVVTNVDYASNISGIPPVYAFADATAGNTLKIENVLSFGGEIFGFGQNDTIDLGRSLAVGTVVYNSTSGILELESATGSIEASVQLASGNFLSSGVKTGTFAVSGTVAGPFNVLTGADNDTILTTGVANDYSNKISGTWQSGSVWAGGSTPGTLDTVLLGDGAKTPFTLTTGSSPVTIGALALTSNPTLLQITSSTTVSSYPIRLFGGTLEVTGGQTLTASAITQSGGTLLLDAGGVLDLTGSPVDGVSPLYNIFPANNGTISVSNSGTAAIEFGSGTVLVNGGTLNAGTGQTGGDGGRINIGYEGAGTPAVLTVQNSGTHAGVVNDTYAIVASDPTSFGVLTLDGNVTWTDQIDPHDTVATRGYMLVGYNAETNNTALTPAFSGTATLAVENGATLTDQTYAEIGASSDSGGSVLVSDGLWNIGSSTTGGFLDVGLGGEGTLFVTDGGTVAVGKGGTFLFNGTSITGGGINLGGSIAGSGSLIVSGAGALVTDKSGMNVGLAGTGDVQVLNGGTIQLTGTNGISIGTSVGASGTFLVSGTDPSSGAPALLSMASTTKGITAGADGQGLLDVESGGSIALNGTGGIAIGQSIDGSGLVIVNGPDAFITLGTASSGIGIAQAGTTTGTLLVENGGTILLNGTGGITDGGFAGSNGLIVIDGPNALIDEGAAGSGMGVGAAGNGTLEIENGGTFALQATGTNAGIGVGQTGGSSGLIVVTGTSSLLSQNTPNAGLAIGGSGQGTLEVQSGGVVTIAGDGLNIGTEGSGTVSVAGAGSSIVLSGPNGAVGVGETGSGVLNITSGGSVFAASGVYIAESSGTSTGVVAVNGGTLTDAGQLTIGNFGAGTLQVLGDGLVQMTGTSSVNVGGYAFGANGLLLINGGGTLSATNGSFGIGGSNVAGFAVIEGGGTLITGSQNGLNSFSDFADINATGTGAASALVTGGTWVSNGSIIVGDTGTGELEIAGGGLVNAGTQSIVIGNQGGGAGTLSVLAGGLLLAGALSLDNSFSSNATGSLDVAGGTVSVGSLSLGANGVATVSSGALSVSGSATIGNNGTGAALSVTGGDVTLGSVNVAFNPGSSGTVTVSGGTLETTGLLNIGDSGSGLVTVDAGGTLIAAGGLQVDQFTATTGTLVVNGGSVSVSNGLSVGNGGTASVIVEAGGTLSAAGTISVTIGNSFGGTGQVTVNDGVFNVSGAQLSIGSGGSLLVENGGIVTDTFSGLGPGVDINSSGGFQANASVTVTGAGSTLNASAAGMQFVVGDNSSGSLTISTGGVVNAGTNFVDIGNQTGGNGTVVVNSGGSFAMNGLNVGSNGAGTLSMTGGTVTDSGSLSIGAGSGASGSATLGGGAILTADGLTVGSSGVGTLTLNGGTITDTGTYTFAGSNTGGEGTIAISGAGAVLNSNAFIISNFGVGVGSVDNGGVVNAASLSVGQFFDGSLTIAGGTITTTGAVSDNVGNASGSDGALSVSGGGIFTDAAGLTFGINSGATGAGTVGAGTVTVGGNLVIGNSGLGTLTVNNGGTIRANGTYDGVGQNSGSFGELVINSGGTFVSAATSMAVGSNAGSSGEVIVNAGGTLQFTEASQSGTQALRIGASGASGTLAAAQGDVLVTGIGALLTTNNNPIAVGNGGVGNLTVSQGGSVVVGTPDSSVDYALALANNGGSGAVTVTGAGSTLTVNGYLLDGRGGTGSLTIENNGKVVVNDAALDNSGVGIGAGRGTGPSAPSNVGGDGVALVTSGGVLDATSTVSGMTVGGDGVDGALTVNNNGTVLTGGGLTVGTATEASGTIYGGSGVLTIGIAGTVLVNNPVAANGYDVIIGNANSSIGATTTGTATAAASGAVTVSGIGALLNANGFGIAVGYLSSGSLTISQGATVLSGTTAESLASALSIGRRADGSVTITDPGSVFRAGGGVYAGRSGSGSLTIENHASLIAGLDGSGVTGISIGGTGLGVSNSGGVNYLITGGNGSGLVTSGGYMFSQMWLKVGTDGTDGELAVNQGGTAEAGTQIVVGDSTTVPGGDTIITPTGSYVASSATLIATAGVLDIGPGGLVKSDGPHVSGTPSVIVGAGAGASGTVNVTGGGSAGVDPAILSTGGDPLMVGQFGEGSILVSQAGTVLAGTTFAHDEAITLGGSVGSTGGLTVTDAGSLVQATGQVDVGGAGSGSLLVENGATVVTGNNAVDANEGFDVAASAGSSGSATVSNGGTLINAGTFVVGDGGVGSLIIQSGGLVITSPGTTGAAAVVANQASASGSSVNVTGAGSDWDITGALIVGNAGAGALNIASGGAVSAASIDTAAQSGGDGIIAVTGTGSSLTVTGSLTLGDQAAGELSILGGATVSAGSLTIGNANPASSGNVDVEGAGSTLHIGTGGVLNVGYAGGGSGLLTIGQGTTLQSSGGIVEAGRASVNNNGGVIDPDYIEFTTASNAGLGENDYSLYVGNIGAVQATDGTGTWTTPMMLTGTSVADAQNNIDNNGDVGEWQLSSNGTLIVNANTVDSGQAFIFE
ncbi:MAG TPA: hypothetical protein VGG99_28185, partial [Acetobacteraceae bacterium]